MQRLALHLTDRCQLDCAHCLRDPALSAGDLPLGVIEAVLRDASQLYGIRRVSLTGGEPTLHPSFADVIDAIARYEMTWDMVSNGHRFERVAERLGDVPARRRSCAQVVFSLDGATDAVHDRIRGAGQRREVLRAIAVAVTHGIPFGITTTLHAANVAELEAIGLDAAQLGARHVTFAMMQPSGTHLDAELGLGPEGWRDALRRVERMSGVLRIPVIAAEGWPNRERMRLCAALRGDTLHVDHRGRLTLCCLHSDVPGDSEGRTITGEAVGGLLAPHRRLIEIQRDALARRLDEIEGSGSPDAWDDFACNSCLRRFGKPHWTSHGTGGSAALRERWRGAGEKTRPRGKNLMVLTGDRD